MKKLIYIKFALFLFTGTLLFSCEKVIDIDLNEAEQRIVIEGNITSEAGPYLVTLSTSGGYFDNSAVQPIENSVVIISDEEGNSEMLTETSAGRYKTETFVGVEDRNYTIQVEIEGETFVASEYLPNKVEIDSLFFKIDDFGGPGPNHEDEDFYNIHCTLTDPVETVDYYRFVTFINGDAVYNGFSAYRVLDDEFFNGNTFTVTLRGTGAVAGDHVEVQLQSIGYNTYEYFRTLNEVLSGGGMSSTPYNPISNLDNNALGYFGAYSFDSQTIVIEE